MNTHRWTITETEDDLSTDWQDIYEGTLEEAWAHVCDTLHGIAGFPPPNTDAPDDSIAATWGGTFEHIDGETGTPTAVATYWMDPTGEGPRLITATITLHKHCSTVYGEWARCTHDEAQA